MELHTEKNDLNYLLNESANNLLPFREQTSFAFPNELGNLIDIWYKYKCQ